MLTKDDVHKICKDELCKINLGKGCDYVVSAISRGDLSGASLELQKILLFSISNCVHKVIEELPAKK